MPPTLRNASYLAPFLLLLMAGCHRSEEEPLQPQRIAFDKVPSQVEEPLPSPDTKGARWVLSNSGQALLVGKPGAPPFLTLACNSGANPPQVTVIRHAPARAGEKALFPIIGNGKISRFKVDAAHVGKEWRWQGSVPVDDPLLEVFAGARNLEATLPGRGTVKIEGSAAPGDFIAGCRGRMAPAAAKSA